MLEELRWLYGRLQHIVQLLLPGSLSSFLRSCWQPPVVLVPCGNLNQFKKLLSVIVLRKTWELLWEAGSCFLSCRLGFKELASMTKPMGDLQTLKLAQSGVCKALLNHVLLHVCYSKEEITVASMKMEP